jgi:hypothetical protein
LTLSDVTIFSLTLNYEDYKQKAITVPYTDITNIT